MKRTGSTRATSPTNTTYSGISNYRTESYRPLRDAPSNQYNNVDPRAIARTHFRELSQYLAAYLAKEPANSRSTARQKLTRLTRQQFQELSTDVYDELMRRQNNTSDNEVPFLPVRDDFHPKRNQARQKLATLPTGRFKDLSSDVYYELARRYPEFKEEFAPAEASAAATSPESSYDYPSPDFPRNGRTSVDQGNDSGYSGSTPSTSAADVYSRRKPSQDMYVGVGRRPSQDTYSSPDRRRPSQDTLGRRSSERGSVTSGGDAQSATAGMGMIIPNKSTIAEEDIQVPYARDIRDSGSTARIRKPEDGSDSEREGEGGEDPEQMSPRSLPAPALGGLSGLSARLQQADEDDSAARSGEDYFNDRASYGRQSVASDRSAGTGSRVMTNGGGRTSVTGTGDDDRIRREYEFKIATMQLRITSLERDLEGAQDLERKRAEDDARARAMEQELVHLSSCVEEKTASVLSMRQELEALKEERARERDMADRLQRQTQDEVRVLRERCEVLESGGGKGDVDSGMLDQLRSDMEGLITELSDLSRHNDELMSAKEDDRAAIRNLESQVKEYKRKYEQAKTELRSAKATSQLYLQPPKVDDQLPVSREGGLVDVHVTGFVSSIDSLLTAGRSSAPTRVLQPMKGVINAVTAIMEDARNFERRPQRDRAEVDLEALQSLRERLEATLSNLVTAAKTHATSAGMAPVSLLDAAASHVSVTVTDIGKTIHIRKASRAEQDAFMQASSSTASAPSFTPSLRTVDELRSSANSTPQRSGDEGRYTASPTTSPRAAPRRPSSNMSSSIASSPPPFDKIYGGKSDISAGGEGPEDAWTELKPYLEAQTEAIVLAIQSVLSGVRNPTPAPNLDDNLETITSIIKSIVSVCKDNFPPASREKGQDILRELTEHSTKLQEVHGQADITKESRQVMAKASFSVANAMKGLMKL